MQKLYLKIIELLGQVPGIKYADLDTGQIHEEKPPLAYPAALVSIDLPRMEDLGQGAQLIEARAQISLVFKALGETNSISPEAQRLKATDYFNGVESVYHHLNGYEDDVFYPFSCTSMKTENLRKGLKVVRLTFETSWHDYTAS